MQITLLDYCDTIPITVQNIMLEHMQEQGHVQKGRKRRAYGDSLRDGFLGI